MSKKIDINNWKEIKVGDLFTVLRGQPMRMQTLLSGNTAIIAAAGYNQGVAGYYDVEAKYNNSITISLNGAGCGSTFYHNYSFSITGDAAVFLEKNKMSNEVKMYITSIYNKFFREKYSYSDKCTPQKIENDIIKLPADNNGVPDWNYMEQCMKKIEEQSREAIKWLNNCNKESKKIKTTKWGNFVIEDLFEIKRPCARSQSNYEDGEIPFIASGNYNNGILKYLKPKENERLDKGNCITVSPVDGSAFYQKNDFLGRGGAGSSIILLYNDNLNENNGTFIATIIRKICCKYRYSDMGSKETIRKEIIKLPIDEKGNPDYDYMDKYMSELVNKTKNKLSCLNGI